MSVERSAHRRAVALMVIAPTLWSIAGVVTRHLSPELQSAGRFEITFWRSVFAALFIAGYLIWRRDFAASLKCAGTAGLISGAMWAIMFVAFMLALTLTSTANTLIVLAIAPLVTALLARIVLQTPIALRTWCAIVVAMAGITAMFTENISLGSPASLAGMLIALAVPLASAVNIVVLKRRGAAIDLVPAVFLGGVFSAALMLPFAVPMIAQPSDVAWLAVLGFFSSACPVR